MHKSVTGIFKGHFKWKSTNIKQVYVEVSSSHKNKTKQQKRNDNIYAYTPILTFRL